MKLPTVRSVSGLVMATALLLSLGAQPAWAFSPRLCPGFLAVEGAPAPAHLGKLTFSPHTHHWKHSPEHKPVVMLAVDQKLPGDRFCGLSLFNNSFGQPSVYLYAGQKFNRVLGVQRLFAEVTAGMLYGYVEPYENKVPLNHNGFSPAIIPSIGYQLSLQDSLQIQILGTAGIMLSFGRNF